VSRLNVQFRGSLYQPVIHFHNFRCWHGKPRSLRQPRRQHLISKHTPMLWILKELHHVKVFIGATHQMPVRSSAHWPNVLDGFHQSSYMLWMPCTEKLSRGPPFIRSSAIVRQVKTFRCDE